MADLGSNLKNIWMKSMEAVGNAASNIASSTRSKVDEMNLVNRRAEILKDFGNQAYVLWQKGEHFPEVLSSQLEELKKLDEQLNDLRAERLAGVRTQTAEDGTPTETVQEEIIEVETAEAPIAETAEEAPELIMAETVEAEAAEPTEESAEETAEADEPVPVIRVEQPAAEETRESLSSAINDLFEQVPTAEEAAGKVNATLDSLEEGLKKFSDSVGDKIDALTDKIGLGKKDE